MVAETQIEPMNFLSWRTIAENERRPKFLESIKQNTGEITNFTSRDSWTFAEGPCNISDINYHLGDGEVSNTIKEQLSNNSSQLWYFLPADSIRFHTLKAQSHKNILHSRFQFASPYCYLCLTNCVKIAVSYLSSPATPLQPRGLMQAPIASLGWYLYFWLTGCKLEVPTTRSLGSINLLEQLT